MVLKELAVTLCLWLIINTLNAQFMIRVHPAGYAQTSVNSVIFRKNALTSDTQHQYIAFYDQAKNLVVGKRRLELNDWHLKILNYKGEAEDAHRSISIQVDGAGYLHIAWDHHNHPLKYIRSQYPGVLDFEPTQSMVASNEQYVSYPEFYRQPNGNLMFYYRDGGSGNGNLVINKYDINTRSWTRVHSNLLDGQGQRNAYWQTCIDRYGHIHLSWTWRESPDVSSNHDLCYAKSEDEGETWIKSDASKYPLPITLSDAEIIVRIPQKSELINQTSMTSDTKGMPYIASYWKSSRTGIPQFHLIFNSNKGWQTRSLESRTTNFTLDGMGTKSIPISRPQILSWTENKTNKVALIFRDEQRGNKVTLAHTTAKSFKKWKIIDLIQHDLGRWEPTLDPDLWQSKSFLNLYMQKVDQIDTEGLSDSDPTPVEILTWKPK